jgi:CubicO group peptidase (beta-lactamase class C family)
MRVAMATCVGLVASVTATGPVATAKSPVPAGAAAVIATYQARIPELMAEQDVPGLAVALVDGDQVLWTEGFGHLDGDRSAPVTTDTIFSVQSMSKLFTATAVMEAAQAGKVRLDEPITTYLPEFTVHSAFEEHPERKITLRMLLSHTVGFTHEAPVGNNNELDPGDFDAHVRSISDTWLRFPVGTGYAYSNLGIDLAGYILERVEGKPFADVMRDSLLRPLGMDRSTFDRTVIRSASDRAVGHVDPYPGPPLDVPMTAAGGLYTSAADLARFLAFQLNDGSIDGRVVLDPKWMDEMRTVPAPHADAPAGYALGVVRHRWNRWDQRPDLFNHGGGGYGFLSDLWWSSPLGIGVAILTNSQDHQLQGDLAFSILADLVAEPGPYHDRLLSLPSRPEAVDPNERFEPPADMADLVAIAAMPPTGNEVARWADCAGAYRVPAWGVISPTGPPDRFLVEGGVPYFEADDDGSLVRHRLVELQADLFLADNGETLDLRGSTPTWGNFRLVRVSGGPEPWQWALLGAAAFAAISWLIAALASKVRRRRRRAYPAQEVVVRHPGWRRLTGLAGLLTATLSLGTIALVAAVPGLIDSGFLGWLEVPLAQRLVLHLPLVSALASGCLVILGAIGWTRGWWTRAVPRRDAALIVSSVVLAAQLLAWHLVGWGLI